MVQGIDRLKARLSFSSQKLVLVATAALEQAAGNVVATAKFLVPKDDGTLAASIRALPVAKTPRGNLKIEIAAGDSSTIVTTTKGRFQLAQIIELGAKKRPAHPFLRPAARLNSRKNRTLIRKAMREAIKVANGTNTSTGT